MNTANKGFSQITQRGFFWENDKFDMLIMASPEIHFLKAEAYAMGYGVAQDMAKAEEEFKTAVSQSIALYYYYDSIGSGENCRRYDAPTDEEIADFANAKWNSTAYVDKLDAIRLSFGTGVPGSVGYYPQCAEPLEIPQHGSELQSVL